MFETSSEKNLKHDEIAATQFVEQQEYLKEEADIAFAIEVLNASQLSERQLASALASWTLHGSTRLADHLLEKGLITQKSRSELLERASCRLKELDATTAKNGGAATESQTKTALDRLDPSGRVAKLFGISGAVSNAACDETREHATRYQLIRKLGQGGLGTVWLARDLNMQRYVALKEMRNARTASKATRDRFRREAEITGRLEHPGIVPIYQVGDDVDSGQAFYTMRFLGKQTLQDAIAEYHERREHGDAEPMHLRHLLNAFINVCQAVGHAHSRKVIHRDLKPENVAIDSFGQVMVIDWGLAKVLDEAIGEGFGDGGLSDVGEGERTLAGQVLGSPLYMAPEQAAGRVDEVNESTDIFGLGAMLYAILTGRAPHEKTRESSGSTSTRQLMTAIINDPTPRAAAVNGDVDPILDAICAKAMAGRRYARYSSTSEFAEDIQRWMAGESVTAYREPVSQRIGRWIQKHQRWSQLIAAAVTIMIVTGITVMIAARQNRLAAQQARFEEFRSDGREIEVQLNSAVQSLSGDLRFMSTLPPIQGIIDARAGTGQSEGEEVWRGRLETIYEGLLRANADYLSVCYLSNSDAGQLQEIVRVERHATEQGYIRRVPQSRLASLESPKSFQDTLELGPGDVKVSLDDRPVAAHDTRKYRRLVGSIPVYDDTTGNVFGMVTIETNLTGKLSGILNALDERFGTIYITDASGHVMVAARPQAGVEIVSPELQVSDFVGDAAEFFSADGLIRNHSDGENYIARRVVLDPVDASCSLGIIQQLETDD